MNHYKARQRQDTKKWEFTVYNRRTGTHPIGYCIDDGGHETPQEAAECFRKFELDTTIVLTPHGKADADTLHRCRICREFTANVAHVGYGIKKSFYLCDDHLGEESIGVLLEPVDEFWSSY